MKRLGLVCFLILTGAIFAWTRWVEATTNRDWKTVERLIGYLGQVEGDGFKVIVPRSDLNILVHGSWLDPQAGLASWFAFKPLSHGSLMTGELVLVDWEVPRVEALLASDQLTLTSIYRPFNGENPGVERIGFMGKGPRVFLAQEIKVLLAATSMPFVTPPAVKPPSVSQTAFSLPVEKILGPAQWAGGALRFSFVPSMSVTSEGVDIPFYMGFETTFYFQPDGKQAKVYGQWVLTPKEARNVAGCLMKNHIGITGTHLLLLDLSPQWVFIDFWAEGDSVKIAQSLEASLRQTQLTGSTLQFPQETPHKMGLKARF